MHHQPELQLVAATVVDLAAYRAAHPREPRPAAESVRWPAAPRPLSARQRAHRQAMLDALGRARPTRALS